jgi:hypothetical protein
MMPEYANVVEGLPVRAEPLGWSEDLFWRMVKVIWAMEGAILLGADPVKAWTISIVSVTKGVRGNEILAKTSLFASDQTSRI